MIEPWICEARGKEVGEGESEAGVAKGRKCITKPRIVGGLPF